jgi:2-phosphosulfolactate phosphatase
LRPAIEDLIGAGAIVDALGPAARRSVEAELAAQVFSHARPDVLSCLLDCQCGRELIELGFQDDVELAAVGERTRAVLGDGSIRA